MNKLVADILGPAVAGLDIDAGDHLAFLQRLEALMIPGLDWVENNSIAVEVTEIYLLWRLESRLGGGAHYVKSENQPAHDGWIRSGDGAYWVIRPDKGYLTTRQFGLPDDFSADATAAAQAAIEACHALGTQLCVDGDHLIDSGSIVVRPGTRLFSFRGAGEYFNGLTVAGGGRLKRSAASTTNVPMVKVDQGGACQGVSFEWERPGGAPDGIVHMLDGEIVTYSEVSGNYIFGIRSGDPDDVATRCIGISFPEGTGGVKYFNRILDNTISECDVGIFMGNQANANTLSGNQMRECLIHYFLDGRNTVAGTGGECLENTVSCGTHTSIVNLENPDPIVVKMINANKNMMIGLTTEAFGKFIDQDVLSCTGNIFLVGTNEEELSYVDVTNGDVDLRFMSFLSFHQGSGQPLLTRLGQSDGHRSGGGSKFQFYRPIEGTLPTRDALNGDLSAGATYNKVIARFGAALTAAIKPTASMKLRLIANPSFGGETCICEVDYSVRKKDTVTGEMVLDVKSVENHGPYILGLYLLTGVAAGDAMGLAVVTGLGDASVLNYLRLDISVTHSAFDSDARFFATINDIETVAADVSPSDVSDAVSLLVEGPGQPFVAAA